MPQSEQLRPCFAPSPQTCLPRRTNAACGINPIICHKLRVPFKRIYLSESTVSVWGISSTSVNHDSQKNCKVGPNGHANKPHLDELASPRLGLIQFGTAMPAEPSSHPMMKSGPPSSASVPAPTLEAEMGNSAANPDTGEHKALPGKSPCPSDSGTHSSVQHRPARPSRLSGVTSAHSDPPSPHNLDSQSFKNCKVIKVLRVIN